MTVAINNPTPATPKTYLQTVAALLAADATTASLQPTYVTLLTSSITTVAGSSLLISAEMSVSNSGSNNGMYLRLTIDGVSKGGRSSRYVNVPATSIAMRVKVTGLAAGAHTIVLQWCVDSGTGQCRPVGAVDKEGASLVIEEVNV